MNVADGSFVWGKRPSENTGSESEKSQIMNRSNAYHLHHCTTKPMPFSGCNAPPLSCCTKHFASNSKEILRFTRMNEHLRSRTDHIVIFYNQVSLISRHHIVTKILVHLASFTQTCSSRNIDAYAFGIGSDPLATFNASTSTEDCADNALLLS
jgi:hypothetical protein